MTNITLSQFCSDERVNLVKFHRWWVAQASLHPDTFPPKMTEGDWLEQFEFFKAGGQS